MQKRPTTKPIAERLYLTDDGIQFDQSRLWLDSKQSGALSFLASASLVRERYKNQVIVSEETHKLLKLYNPSLNALICQYNRPFSIGRYNLELLPAGNVLGGASLYIESEGESVLYAPLLALGKPNLCRSFQLKTADYLILKANTFESSKFVSHRKKELDRFITKVNQCLAEDKTPIIFSPLLHTASELCKTLSQEDYEPIVHKYIFDVNKAYESFGYDLGSYRLWNPNKIMHKNLLILPESCRPQKILHSSQVRELLYVNNGIEFPSAHNKDYTFNIPSADLSTNLTSIIKEMTPKKTFIFGPYAQKLTQNSKLSHESIELLEPFNQNSLL